MKKILFIVNLAYMLFFISQVSMANTFPTEAGYRYLKGCFGEERTHDHEGVDIVGATAGVISGRPIYAFKYEEKI